jgi:apolipoprotein D and lipocalin family protein
MINKLLPVLPEKRSIPEAPVGRPHPVGGDREPGWWARAPILLATTLCLIGPGTPAAAEAGPDRATPVPVARVDLERYTGTWYELAKIPNRFQKDCAGGTTATYSLRSDGRIEVVNRCRKPDGTFKEARGVARVVDNATQARLKVSFFSVLGIRPFWGDYWIIGLGADYRFAVVGSPDRKYGWVLSRTPDPGPEVLERAFAILTRQGYDPADFEITRQDAP